MNEIKEFYSFFAGLNPFWLVCIVALCGYIAYKWLPKHLEFRFKEYKSIFDELQKINVHLEKIDETLERNNKYTKELFVDRIKSKIFSMRERFSQTGEVPKQEEMDVLYDMWDRIEKLGDGYQEVKDSIDKLKEIMYV